MVAWIALFQGAKKVARVICERNGTECFAGDAMEYSDANVVVECAEEIDRPAEIVWQSDRRLQALDGPGPIRRDGRGPVA